jgi:hypothetical protein
MRLNPEVEYKIDCSQSLLKGLSYENDILKVCELMFLLFKAFCFALRTSKLCQLFKNVNNKVTLLQNVLHKNGKIFFMASKLSSYQGYFKHCTVSDLFKFTFTGALKYAAGILISCIHYYTDLMVQTSEIV